MKNEFDQMYRLLCVNWIHANDLNPLDHHIVLLRIQQLNIRPQVEPTDQLL